jgi:hypothetical protein
VCDAGEKLAERGGRGTALIPLVLGCVIWGATDLGAPGPCVKSVTDFERVSLPEKREEGAGVDRVERGGAPLRVSGAARKNLRPLRP